MIPRLLPEKQDLLCPDNTCTNAPHSQADLAADGKAKQAQERTSEELLWYSETKRPRKAEGVSLLPQARQHYKAWNFSFKERIELRLCRIIQGCQRENTIHIKFVPTPDRAASP